MGLWMRGERVVNYAAAIVTLLERESENEEIITLYPASRLEFHSTGGRRVFTVNDNGKWEERG